MKDDAKMKDDDQPIESPRRNFFRRVAGAGGRAEGEAHIASFVVHLRPERMADFVRAVDARAGLEVSWRDPAGKAVVLADADGTDALSRANEFLGGLPGVASVGMAAHYLDEDRTGEAEGTGGTDGSDRAGGSGTEGGS